MEETRASFDKLVALPEHVYVVVMIKSSRKQVTLKAETSLNLVEGDLVIVDTKLFADKPLDIHSVGSVVEIKPEYKGPRVVEWVIGKVDLTKQKELNAQESRITDLHKELDHLWRIRNKDSKLDVLWDEYLAKKQAEAEMEEESSL